MVNLTPEIIARVMGGHLAFSDPCVICGVTFNDCPHTVLDTEPLIKRVRKMTKKERENFK